jgi:hypothetical protein
VAEVSNNANVTPNRLFKMMDEKGISYFKSKGRGNCHWIADIPTPAGVRRVQFNAYKKECHQKIVNMVRRAPCQSPKK